MCKVSLLCAAVLLCSCAGSREPSAFRTYLESEPAGFDPAFAVDVPSGRLCALLYDGLLCPGREGGVEGGLAERWDISPDGMLYTFYLRDARFSDGSQVTAGDVEYSLERLLSPEVASPRGWMLSAVVGAEEFKSGASDDLEGVSASGAKIVKIRLARPFPPFPSMLAMPSAGVVSSEWAASRGSGGWRSPVCSGPWVLSEWKEAQRIVLKRNDHYRTPPELERVIFRIIPERMTQVAEFEVGNLDHLQVPKAELRRWSADPHWGALMESSVELAVTYIGLNNQKPPLDRVGVRRALNCAVDKHAIVARLMKGAAVQAAGAIPPGLRGHDPSRAGYQYDRDLAAELLEEEGLAGGFDMEIWYRDGGGAEQVLEALQAYLKEVGVRVTLQAREWGTLKEAINRGVPDAYYLDWYADYPDAENFLYPLFFSGNWGGGGNRARFADPGVDSMLVEARAETDPESRYDLYRRIDEMVAGRAPWIYLWHPVRVELRQPWVEGPLMHPLFYGQRYLLLYKTRSNGRESA